ncbi:hypothetical protein ACQKEM_16430 [Pseudomonas sp. NPDC077382]|uniref:hypothetical protein n=1 Tax=Stutzerimonas xanthomarina TaxID=271420 RepID=UPI0029BA70D2|nr:hypothetical protein [Stutzerimonas xanthomarina]MDX2350774.1 hypothetical protein [Stutzerimonas xanthomarina]
MTQLNIALALMGGVAVCIALLSALIKRSPVSEPALAMLIGVAVGPYGLSWLDLHAGATHLAFSSRRLD